MSLTMPIAKKLRDEMEADPFYHYCCLLHIKRSSYTKIEWHHNFTWAGKRLNEKWCILPLEKSMHARAGERWIKEKLDRIMLNRADEATLRKYSKAVDLVALRDRLNVRHEDQENHSILQSHP